MKDYCALKINLIFAKKNIFNRVNFIECKVAKVCINKALAASDNYMIFQKRNFSLVHCQLNMVSYIYLADKCGPSTPTIANFTASLLVAWFIIFATGL